MKYIYLLALPLLAALSLSSCVSQSTYDEMVAKRDSLQKVADSYLLNYKNSEDKVFAQNIEAQTLKNDLAKQKQTVETLKSQLESLKQNANKENSELLDKISQLEADKLKLQSQIQKNELKLNDINDKLKARERAMNSLKERLNKALLGFTESGLTVSIKDGKVYVSLSSQLLFKSGSTAIDKTGQEALLELAKVLNQQQDLNILVEGHTDNQPVSGGGRFDDNWDLSVLRSTEVVRFLTQKGAVEPTRVTASGKSEYYPISSNETKETRSANRRTDIIITPKLDEVMNMLKTE